MIWSYNDIATILTDIENAIWFITSFISTEKKLLNPWWCDIQCFLTSGEPDLQMKAPLQQ